jgi:hypothetical protein
MKGMALILLALSAPASASTIAAWAAGDKLTQAACAKASGLANARASAPVHFSDVSGKSVVTVTGRYRQRFMNSAAGKMLCLYDRHTKTAETVEE